MKPTEIGPPTTSGKELDMTLSKSLPDPAGAYSDDRIVILMAYVYEALQTGEDEKTDRNPRPRDGVR